jgi:tetratricopeptide (TPR) repeat protein
LFVVLSWRGSNLVWLLLGAMAATGCARTPRSATSTPQAAAPTGKIVVAAEVPTLEEAMAALDGEEPARAVALFGRFIASEPDSDEDLAAAYLGLAAAHEKLRDCAAALLTYESYLSRFPEPDEPIIVWARQGACQAELGRFEASAESYRKIAAQPEQLPSIYVEALARQGFALFNLERYDEADEVLARADEIFEEARAGDTERFSNYYFVGMARFYRAAIIHVHFRDVTIELPEKVMEEAFKKKIELLSKAQDAYNHTIEAKHLFWVSAAGYQLGHLFGEFYDAMMYAPVPKWLDDRQRRIYYAELKKQVKPVIDKATWVFEKNLETARKFGYESPFTEMTEAKLAHMQKVLASEDPGLGQPNPRLIREDDGAVAPPEGGSDEPPSASERKLFVPEPTSL